MVQLTSPDYIGGRHAAAAWLAALGEDFTDVRVDIDCSALVSTSPSFVDELLRILIVDRGAAMVKMQDVPLDVAKWAHETRHRRELGDAVMVDIRAT